MRSYCARGKNRSGVGRLTSRISGKKRKHSDINQSLTKTRMGTCNQQTNRGRKKTKKDRSSKQNNSNNDSNVNDDIQRNNVERDTDIVTNTLQSINMFENETKNDDEMEDIDMETLPPQIRHVDTMIESKIACDDDVDIDLVKNTLQNLNFDYAPSEQFTDFHQQILTYPHYGIRGRNNDNTVFIMPDFDYKYNTIKYASFRHVYKLDTWVCNCDQFVYKNNRQYCDHTILAILYCASNPTKLPFFPYDPSDTNCVSETDDGSVMLFMAPKYSRKMGIYSVENNDNRYSFVHINNDFKNIICEQHKGKRGCRHRALLLKVLDDEVKKKYKSQSNQPAQDTVFWDEEEGFGHHSILAEEIPKCISFKPIPVPAVWQTNYDDTPDQDAYYAATKQRNIPVKLTPKINLCECGESLSDTDDYLIQKNALLFDTSTNHYVDVYNRRCAHCGNNYVYDGLEDKIFNYNDNILIFHDVFQQVLFLRHQSKCPLNTFITTQLSLYSGNNSITPFFNGVTFNKLLAIFRALQDFDKILKCKGCAAKGKMPEMIGCDASSLLLQKKYIQGVISPKETTRFNDITITMQRELRNVRDCYVVEPSLRKRLDLFLKDHDIRNYRTDDVKSSGPWSTKDKKSLFKELRKKGYGKIVDMIEWILKEKGMLHKHLLDRLGDILRGCSRYILLSHIIPNPIIDPLLTYSVDTWSDIKQNVSTFQPAIYSVHEFFLKTNVEVPACWIALVKELAKLSRQSISQKEAIRAESPSLPAAEERHQTIFDQYEASGSCYGYKIHHTRPKYDFQSERKGKSKKKNVESDNNIKVGDCNKYFHKFSTMSNGIVIFKCLEHEEIMGFHVMSTPEGLNDYFSALIMMYEDDKAPKLVLGDIACQLERYCMNREPSKFKNTLFLNDEMHSQGHKCGPLYNVKYYKDSLSSFVFLNDPSIEQTNRICKNLKISTMYMKLNTFMQNVCNILEIESRKSIRKRECND